MIINSEVCPFEVPILSGRRGTFLMYNYFVFYVYILKLVTNTYYIGYSASLKERIKEHQEGKVRWTRKLKPIELIYYAAFKSKKKALDFEKYLKTSSGFAFRNKRLI